MTPGGISGPLFWAGVSLLLFSLCASAHSPPPPKSGETVAAEQQKNQAAAKAKAKPKAKPKPRKKRHTRSKPKPAPKPTPPPPPEPKAEIKPGPDKTLVKQILTKEEADNRYRQAQALERLGDHRGALDAYLAAGGAGHGQAQKRLGEIYDRGNSSVSRDYDAALRWYQKAREQGIVVPKPHAYITGR